jgi:hypothetical protein
MEKDEIYPVYRQSTAILKLLSVLFKSKDTSLELISIERETISKDKTSPNSLEVFSAKKFDHFMAKNVDSSLFTIIFTCYTSCFRNFLNHIAKNPYQSFLEK